MADKKQRNHRLNTATDCRRFLAALANDVKYGRIEPQKANCCGYLINIIVKSIEVHEMEGRIERLEQAAESKDGKPLKAVR